MDHMTSLRSRRQCPDHPTVLAPGGSPVRDDRAAGADHPMRV